MLNRVDTKCLQYFQLDADDYQLYSVTDRNKKPTKLKENLPYIKNRNTQPERKSKKPKQKYTTQNGNSSQNRNMKDRNRNKNRITKYETEQQTYK